MLRLDKRVEDKGEGERGREEDKRRLEEEKRRRLRKEVERGRRKDFEQGARKEIRVENNFQPRITQCQSQYQTKVTNFNLYTRLRFLGQIFYQHIYVGGIMLVGFT